jgi:hypothetical protein
MEPLYDKILVFLIQLPPSLQIAEMINLQNKIKSFPIVDYKISIDETNRIEEDKHKFRIYKQLRSKTRQTDISDFFK